VRITNVRTLSVAIGVDEVMAGFIVWLARQPIQPVPRWRYPSHVTGRLIGPTRS
jgi:hypothetical protein